MMRARWLLLAGLAGCAPNLRDNLDEEDNGSADTAGTEIIGDDTGEEGHPVRETVIDATSETEWVLYDLEAAARTEESGWDLGIRRYAIQLNGGVSGDGGVEATWIDGVDLDDVTEAPAEGWVTDEADTDEDGLPQLALDEWYDYDSSTHVLSPKQRVYLLRSTEGGLYKLQILDYYDDAGTSGFLRFHWAVL